MLNPSLFSRPPSPYPILTLDVPIQYSKLFNTV